MESFLTSPIESEICTKDMLKNISQQLAFLSIGKIFRIGFSFEEFNTANINFYQMNTF